MKIAAPSCRWRQPAVQPGWRSKLFIHARPTVACLRSMIVSLWACTNLLEWNPWQPMINLIYHWLGAKDLLWHRWSFIVRDTNYKPRSKESSSYPFQNMTACLCSLYRMHYQSLCLFLFWFCLCHIYFAGILKPLWLKAWCIVKKAPKMPSPSEKMVDGQKKWYHGGITIKH
jgi:hypothetical protein